MKTPTLQERIENIFPKELPERFNDIIPYKDGNTYLIDGEIRRAERTSPVYSSVCLMRDGKPERVLLGNYPMLTGEESMSALDAAVKAYDNGNGAWPSMTIRDRMIALSNFVDRMKLQRENVVKLEMLEIGKNKRETEAEFDRTVRYIEDTIEEMGNLSKREDGNGTLAYLIRTPNGVALCMGPSNYPLNETFTTLLPALAMGNTVVSKSPKIGMLCLTPLYEAFRESFPEGAINFINGDGREIITPIMQSGKLDVFAFIGSSGAFDKILENYPRIRKLKINAGLEAKNPGIILEDANLEDTVNECVKGALTYNGQRCTALKILYIPISRADEFVERLSDKVSNLSIGMPWENSNITPLPVNVDYFTKFVYDAVSKGAKVVNPEGGKINGSFFFPAVLYPVTPDMNIYNQEQFGPVVPVAVYDDIKEVIEAIQRSRYGQQVSIFGNDYENVRRITNELRNHVSRINLNTQCMRGPDNLPFTGRKDSAVGTLSIRDALDFFSQPFVVGTKFGIRDSELLTETTNFLDNCDSE